MNAILRPGRIGLIALTMVSSIVSGCQRKPPDRPTEKALPPAYTRNHINDPALREAAEQIRTWALQQLGAGGQPLYSRAETPRHMVKAAITPGPATGQRIMAQVTRGCQRASSKRGVK